MISRKFKFNKRQLGNLPPTPADSRSKETEYTDEGCTGLKLIVNRQGRKRYLFRYTFNGVKRSLQIGEYPAIDITTARQIANDHRRQIALGNDPKQLREQQRAQLSFIDFVELHYLPYARVNKLTADSDEGNLKLHIYPKWRRKALNQIGQQDIQKLLDELLTDRKPATVNRIRSLILRIFRLGLEWGHLDTHSGQFIKKYKENNQRHFYLSNQQISAFLSACDQEKNRVQSNALKLALVTGMRIGEICNAQWTHFTVDAVGANLFLPHTKTGLSRTVVLNPAAQAVLKDQKQHRQKGNPYIFPGAAKGKPISHPKKAFARIKKAAGIADHYRIHDLRHTFASLAVNEGGATLYDVQHLLGHSSPHTSTRYAHLGAGRLRAVSDQISNVVQQVSKS